MRTGALGVYQTLTGVLDAVGARFDAYGTRPTRVSVVPGAIVWDECDCNSGELLLAVTGTYASDVFPETSGPQMLATSCAPAMLVTECVLQCVRCMPIPQGNDLTVDVGRLDTAAQQVISDGVEMYEGVLCYLDTLKSTYEIMDYRIDPGTVQGPEGGCGGTEQRFAFALNRG